MDAATEMEIESSQVQVQATPKKRGRKPKSELNLKSEPSDPTRITRSKVAPYWTIKESLVLVNVISVIEADCLRNVSSHQKWKMIVEHCTALDVHRTLNQCRTKWNSLLTDYNQIKLWDSKTDTASSYWDLDSEKRREFQLPHNFDSDLFHAIDDYVRAQQNDADTDPDPDTDAEPEPDLLAPIPDFGLKRHKRRSISEDICELEPQEFHAEVAPQKSCEEVNPNQMCFESETPPVQYGVEETRESHLEENEEVDPQMSFEVETPQVQHGEEEPRETHLQENEEVNNHVCLESETPQVQHEEQETRECHVEEIPQESCRKENLHIINVEEESPKSSKDKNKKIMRSQKKKIIGKKDEEEMAVQNLCENAEMILAVVKGNLPERAEYGVTTTKSVQDFQTDFARRQGDSLIACLGNIVSVLHKFPYLVQEK